MLYALGGRSDRRDRTEKLIDRQGDKWKPTMAVLKAAICFVRATQRFQPKATEDAEEQGETEDREQGERNHCRVSARRESGKVLLVKAREL